MSSLLTLADKLLDSGDSLGEVIHEALDLMDKPMDPEVSEFLESESLTLLGERSPQGEDDVKWHIIFHELKNNTPLWMKQFWFYRWTEKTHQAWGSCQIVFIPETENPELFEIDSFTFFGHKAIHTAYRGELGWVFRKGN